MSDTGEQGLKPQDPADQAGVGGGIVPDDQVDGYEQLAELAEHEEPPAKRAGGAAEPEE